MDFNSESTTKYYVLFDNDKTISDDPHSDRLKSYSTFQNHLKEKYEKLKKNYYEISNDQISTNEPNFDMRKHINSFFNFISNKNPNDKSKKSSILLGKIHELLTKIDILEINLPPKTNFDDIAIIQNLIEKLNTFQITNDKKENIDYNKIIPDIIHLNLVLDQIIDLLRSVRNIESIVSSVFQRIFDFIQIIQNDKRYEKIKSKINSSSFEDLLIDKYYNLIFTFKPNPKDEPKRTDDIGQNGHITANDDIGQNGHITANDDITQTGHITTNDDITQTGRITTNDDISQTGHITTNDDITQTGHITTNDDITQTGHITEIFTKLINEDLLPIFNDIKLKNENEETTIEEILKSEILNIPKELSEIISQIVEKKGTIKESLSLLETFCMRFDKSSKGNLSIRNIYLNSKFHIPQKIPFNLLFQSFEPYIGKMKEIYFYKDVLTSFKDEYSIPKLRTIHEQFERLIEMIQINGKFYDIEFILRMFLEHTLNTQLLISKNPKNSDSQQTIIIPEIKAIQSVNNLIENFNFFVDDKLNFVIRKGFRDEQTEDPFPNETERELRILGGCFSKHIAHMKNDMNFSYFPNGTLDFINSKEGRIELTNVDKIVMIIEIATALKDLHSHGEYHGNLSNQFIFINSNKDAYIGSIRYDSTSMVNASRIKSPFYYRAPEYLLNIGEDKQDVKQIQMYDIFAFGVLMYEIITRISPKIQFGNKSRGQRYNILTAKCEKDIQIERKDKDKEKTDENAKIFKNYFEFLLINGSGNEVFENDFKEMKEIIEKCMKPEATERYSSFKELIECIKESSIYKDNKDEIEFRLSHAINACEYRCTLTDLVESYYRGQTESKYVIQQFLSGYQKLLKNAIDKEDNHNSMENQESDEIIFDDITTIYKTFGIEIEDYTKEYKEIFNQIIQLFYHNKYDKSQEVDEGDPLLKKSIEINSYKNKIRIIIPVCSLKSFIEHNKDGIKEYSLAWLYLIAKELSYLQSQNIDYINFSIDSIGLYYHKCEKKLIPLVLPYYYYHKKYNGKAIKTTEKQSYYTVYYNNAERVVLGNTTKFHKPLLKIAEELQIFSPEIVNIINNSESIGGFLYNLYNYIKNNADKNQFDLIKMQYSNSDYTVYKITYPVLEEVFNHFVLHNYSLRELTVDFESIYQMIFNLLDNFQKQPEMLIKDNIPPIIRTMNIRQTAEEISNLILKIKLKCDAIRADKCDKDPISSDQVITMFRDISAITNQSR